MNQSKRDKFAWMLAAVAFPVTTAALTGNVHAECTPAAPVNNTTVSCTGAFEGTLMSDRSRTTAAKAGLKFAF